MLADAAAFTGASQVAVDESFAHIQKAADKARLWLQNDYYPGLTPRAYQLMTELARVRDRARLSQSPNGHLINALLYGAQAAGVLDIQTDGELDEDPTDYPTKGLALLRTLAPGELRRAADAARDPAGMLSGEAGRPESGAVQNYILAVVGEHSQLSGKPGARISRTTYGSPSGPLLGFVRACLAVVAPELGDEAIIKRLKSVKA